MPGHPPPQPGALVLGWETSVAVNKGYTTANASGVPRLSLEASLCQSLPPPPNSLEGRKAYAV